MSIAPGNLRWAVIGSLAAIAVTTWMDATGLAAFSALSLAPLLAVLWWVQRLSRREMAFTWGRRRDYLVAVAYPVVVIGATTLIAFLGGAVDLTETNWQHFWLNLVVGGLSTIVAVIITEEGFFRGWLWASLRKAGATSNQSLLWTSVVFSLWHLSAVALPTGFDLPAAQIPVYMVTATFLGLIWGMLRRISGSVIVASVSHGVWNGFAYALFAFGTKTGALGVTETSIYGPEVGWVGLVLNAAFAFGLWRWMGRRRAAAPGDSPG